MELKVTKKQNNSDMCVVCGVYNDASLKSVFYELENDMIVGITQPKDIHQSYPNRMHGGMISALLDETLGRAAQIGHPDLWAVTGELSVRFKKPDVAVVKLGAPPEIRRAALFDPRRERIVRDRNGKIGVRALRHGDEVPEHALTALRLFLLSAYRFRTERSRRQKKEKAKVALSVADGGIVW